MGYEPAAPCRRAKAFGAQLSNGVKTMVQAHIVYSGVVQGVGFRLTTQRKAKELHLAGWVRNLSDGRVELLVQGTQDIIEDFLLAIQNKFQENIKERKMEIINREDTHLHSFDIYPTYQGT